MVFGRYDRFVRTKSSAEIAENGLAMQHGTLRISLIYSLPFRKESHPMNALFTL